MIVEPSLVTNSGCRHDSGTLLGSQLCRCEVEPSLVTNSVGMIVEPSLVTNSVGMIVEHSLVTNSVGMIVEHSLVTNSVCRHDSGTQLGYQQYL